MICFHCGKDLVKITTGKNRGELAMVKHDYHGSDVRSHKVCFESWKKTLPVTAQETVKATYNE